MGKQYIVVEVLDPTSVEGVQNIWVPVDQDPADIANGFQSLRNSGMFPTGTIQRCEIDSLGNIKRLEKFEKLKAFANDGFRTMSAFLRV